MKRLIQRAFIAKTLFFSASMTLLLHCESSTQNTNSQPDSNSQDTLIESGNPETLSDTLAETPSDTNNPIDGGSETEVLSSDAFSDVADALGETTPDGSLTDSVTDSANAGDSTDSTATSDASEASVDAVAQLDSSADSAVDSATDAITPIAEYTDVERDSVIASPKGTYLVYPTLNYETYIQSVASGTRLRLDTFNADTTDARRAAFADDESRVAFKTVNLVSIRPDGTNRVDFPNSDNVTSFVMVGSNRILWSNNRSQIWSAPLDGSSTPLKLWERQSNDPLLSVSRIIVSSDNSYAVFQRDNSTLLRVYINNSSPALSLGEVQYINDSANSTHILGVVSSEVRELSVLDGTSRVVIAADVGVQVRGNLLLWGQNYTQVWKGSRTAPTNATKIADQGGWFFGTNHDGSYVYWWLSSNNTLLSLATTGSATPVAITDKINASGPIWGLDPAGKKIGCIGENNNIRIATLSGSANNGVLAETSGTARIDKTVQFNGTGSHLFYLKGANPTLNAYELRAADSTSGTPKTIDTGVWRWGVIPNSSKVFYYKDITGITDMRATLKVASP